VERARGDAAALCSFEAHKKAAAWLGPSLVRMPAWVKRTCVEDRHCGVICVDADVEGFETVFVLLCAAGAQMVPKASTPDMPKLFKTFKALNGTVAIARMLRTVDEAETWLAAVRAPLWVLKAATARADNTTEGDRADTETDDFNDDIIIVSDHEMDEDTLDKKAFKAVARTLPSPPTPKRTILSLRSVNDSMLLFLSSRPYPLTGVIAASGSGGEAHFSRPPTAAPTSWPSSTTRSSRLSSTALAVVAAPAAPTLVVHRYQIWPSMSADSRVSRRHVPVLTATALQPSGLPSSVVCPVPVVQSCRSGVFHQTAIGASRFAEATPATSARLRKRKPA